MKRMSLEGGNTLINYSKSTPDYNAANKEKKLAFYYLT